MLAIAFIVVGALLAVVSALADFVGLGAPTSTFGWKQLLGVVLGIVIVAAGVVLLRQGDDVYEDEEYAEVEDGEVEHVDEPVTEERT